MSKQLSLFKQDLLSKYEKRRCPICYKVYYAVKTRLKHGRQTTCSRSCSYELRAQKMSKKKTEFTCPVCKKVFKKRVRKESQTVYCSQECAYKGRTLGYTKRHVDGGYDISDEVRQKFSRLMIERNKERKRNGNYGHSEETKEKISKSLIQFYKDNPSNKSNTNKSNKQGQSNKQNTGVSTVTSFCKECGQKFSYPKWADKKYCCRDCFYQAHSKEMKGKNNPAWIDGRSYDKKCFRGFNWSEQRKKCYSRDNYTCQVCGVQCVGRRSLNEENGGRLIQCHHIEDFVSEEESNNLDNLITLCASCHKKVHEDTIKLGGQ